MSFISDLLARTVSPRVRAELQPHLRGIFGGIIRNYLPQVWFFSTESGTATLYVDRNGIATVTEGRSGSPDVELTWSDRDAYNSLMADDRSQIPPGTQAPSVLVRTSKGKAAYNQLRKRLGL